LTELYRWRSAWARADAASLAVHIIRALCLISCVLRDNLITVRNWNRLSVAGQPFHFLRSISSRSQVPGCRWSQLKELSSHTCDGAGTLPLFVERVFAEPVAVTVKNQVVAARFG
jgi:hypothetical protein